MNVYAQTELEAIQRDAFSSEGKSFEQRTAMFLGLMEMVEALQNHLSLEERARRKRIAEQLDPLPEPWWRNVRKEALAEYECQTSST
jgi:hypothetical protein